MIAKNAPDVVAVTMALAFAWSIQANAQQIDRRCRMQKNQGTECTLTCNAARANLVCDPPADQCRSECGVFGPTDFPAGVLYGITGRAQSLFRPTPLTSDAASEAMLGLIQELSRMPPQIGTYAARFSAPLREPIKFVSVGRIDRGEAPAVEGFQMLVVFDMLAESWARLRETPPATLVAQASSQVRIARDRGDGR